VVLAGTWYIFSFLIFTLIPGVVLLRWLRLRIACMADVGLAVFVGLAISILISYYSGLVGLPNILIVYLGLALYFFLWHKHYRGLAEAMRSVEVGSVVMIILGSVAFAALNWGSGVVSESGYEMRGTNATDGFIHLAYTARLTEEIPPERPGVAGERLHGYHYFSNLFFAQMQKMTGMELEDILFRYGATTLALLYGLGFYIFGRVAGFSQKENVAVLVMAYLGFGFVGLSEFFNISYPGMQYPIALVHNPSTLLGIAFLVVGFGILLRVDESWRWGILAGIVLGVVTQTKVYAGLLGILGLCVYVAWKLCSDSSLQKVFANSWLRLRSRIGGKKFQNPGGAKVARSKSIRVLIDYALPIILTGVVTYTTFWWQNQGSGSLIWAPMQFLDLFMNQQGLEKWYFADRMQIFRESANWKWIIASYGQALLLYLLIHSGNHLVLLSKISNLREARFWKNDVTILIGTVVSMGLIVPLLFLQDGSVYNTVQFQWICGSLLAIPSGLALASLVQLVNVGRWRKVCSAAVILFVLVVGGMAYWRDVPAYLLNEAAYVLDLQDYQILRQIKDNAEVDLVVVLPEVEDKTLRWYRVPLVSALSQKQTYLEKGFTPHKEPEVVKEREEMLLQIIGEAGNCSERSKELVRSKLPSEWIVDYGENECLKNMAAQYYRGNLISLYKLGKSPQR
jgi:hypothetical protein